MGSGHGCPACGARAITPAMRLHSPTARFSLASAAVCFLFVVITPGWSAQPLKRTELNLLGTTCEITLYAGGSDAALDAAFSRIADIEARMTINREDSEVIRVNNAAGLHAVTVTPDVFYVISRGLEFSTAGNGAFDITIAPLVKLWGIGTAAAHVPRSEEIRQALARVGYRNLVLSKKDSSAFLKKPGMGIDLGAIAKGYAADEVERILREHGVTSALVNLGGNVLTMGKKPDGSPWRIGIQNPEEPRGTHLGIVEVSAMAVVTSGTYERFFEQGGKRYHHILDTTTGYPVWNGLSAVTIVTANSTTADGYSTLVFTLGLEKGRKVVESTHGAVEAVFITDSHQIYVTPGLRSSFTITDPRFTLMK
jgi:FAD:protein FMN transferase